MVEEPKQIDNISEILHSDVLKAIDCELKNRGYSNVKITFYQGTKAGDNFLGIITELKIKGTYNSQDKELFWVVKSAPQNEMFRQKLLIDELFKREVHMYNVLKQFQKFEIERGIRNPFNSYATFIMDYLEPNKECVIMADMKRQKYVLKNHSEPLNYSHVKLVLKEYAKLHAISFAMKNQTPNDFQKIADATKEMFFLNRNLSEWDLQYKENGQRLINLFNPANDQEVIDFLQQYQSKGSKFLNKLFLETNEYSVICHGDNWMNNMLWKYDEMSGKPTQLCLLDFQLGRYGSPAYDLSYFLFTCADPHILENNYMNMLKYYYTSFCQKLHELGCKDPHRLFPFSALLDELKMKSVFGFHMSISVLQLVLQPRNESTSIEWYTSKNVNDMIKCLRTTNNVYDDLFATRAKAVISLMAEMGYFTPLLS